MKNRIATLTMLLVLEGVLWVTAEASAPKIALADTTRLDLSLERQPNETYESLVRRAEALATAEAQARFGQDSGVEDISATVAAQNQGQIVPVLSFQVSRSQWYGNPYIKPWAKYFANAKALLRFENAARNTSAPTQTTNPVPRQGASLNRYNRYPGSRYPSYPGQSYPAQPRNSNPYNQYSPRPQPGNPGQLGNTNTGAPNQTTNPSSGMVPQVPVPPQPPIPVPGINPGSASTGVTSTGSNSTSTPTNLVPTPASPSSNRGGTTINSFPGTGFPNNSGTTPGNYPATTPSYRGGTTNNY